MRLTRLRPALTLAATGAGITLLALAAAPAAAHITVSTPDATAGGFGKLVFRVPTESDTASTTKLTITLPTETPFAFVSSKVMPRWRVDQRTEQLDEPIEAESFTISEAVTTVTWTAEQGAGIAPGEFDEFELSVGPFPDTTDPLMFPTVQTYSDGEIVRWDEPANADGSEPEHPAPQLTLGAATADGHGSAEGEEAADAAAPTVSASSSGDAEDSSESDALARALGVGGLVLGAAAAVFAGLAWRNTRSSS